MIVDIEQRRRAMPVALPQWSAAEVLNIPLSDNLSLRAIICRLAAGRWQWSILSIDGERGELISVGLAPSLQAARVAATSEVAKCVENPLE